MAKFTVTITVDNREYFDIWSYIQHQNRVLDSDTTMEQTVAGIAQRCFSSGYKAQLANMRLGLRVWDSRFEEAEAADLAMNAEEGLI